MTYAANIFVSYGARFGSNSVGVRIGFHLGRMNSRNPPGREQGFEHEDSARAEPTNEALSILELLGREL